MRCPERRPRSRTQALHNRLREFSFACDNHSGKKPAFFLCTGLSIRFRAQTVQLSRNAQRAEQQSTRGDSPRPPNRSSSVPLKNRPRRPRLLRSENRTCWRSDLTLGARLAQSYEVVFPLETRFRSKLANPGEKVTQCQSHVRRLASRLTRRHPCHCRLRGPAVRGQGVLTLP